MKQQCMNRNATGQTAIFQMRFKTFKPNNNNHSKVKRDRGEKRTTIAK